MPAEGTPNRASRDGNTKQMREMLAEGIPRRHNMSDQALKKHAGGLK